MDSNLFVKLTTSSNQWIGKFQIINDERARGIRRKKRETLFSKQHRSTSFLAYFELDRERERENSKAFGCAKEIEYVLIQTKLHFIAPEVHTFSLKFV